MDIPADDNLVGLDFDVDSSVVKKKEKCKSSKAKQYRLSHDIKVSAINRQSKIPPPIYSFWSKFCQISDLILHNLSELGYKTPTPIQSQSIPIMMQHRNLLACAPTGSGKTAAYLLPVLNQLLSANTSENSEVMDNITEETSSKHKIFPFAVILAPTQELMHQIRSEAIRLFSGIQADCYIAALHKKHYFVRYRKKARNVSKNDVLSTKPRKVRELKLPSSTKILISTPSRLSTLLSLPSEHCPIDLSRLSWLVVDECDKMLEVNFNDISFSNTEHGNKTKYRPRGFHNQVAPIFEFIQKVNLTGQSIRRPLVALFSATVPDEVVSWARNQLPVLLKLDSSEYELIQLRVGIRNAAVSTVKQELRYCATEQGKLLEMRYLLANGLAYPCLIFMQSRDRANEILKEILLSDADILANVISSDKTEAQRASVVRAFREGQLHVLICTDLLGRGIDFKGVSMVVNYDVPPLKQEYIHRVGRTGRAGHHGRAITLWTDSDLPHMDGILSVMKRSGSEVDEELERLVNEWKKRRVNLMCKQSKAERKQLLDGSISRRRGERRLAYKVLKNCNKEKNAENIDIHDKSSWFRPWNPHRGRISEVPGALSKKRKIG
ncbi:putative dead box ATP-dependent RNA helicase [Schistosoma mansoni]|uniref:ATP-dependent RNA helicase n=1 Tax=Schistosoma mansoni TaxID=6183 RepID=G4VN93_SCHMA|nr:putative dead box ATP-dependent RNA helicase [Schistosoma mansoni]|eukprot:XP_018654713.1 putative dead box ATP-dependent RNA helicase [Schistosoma mansoni]